MEPGYSLAERMRRLLCDEVWTIGVVGQPIEDVARRGIEANVHWLPRPTAGSMLADPSYRLHADGSRTLYAEQLDYHGRRVGEIWRALVGAEADLTTARFAPLLVCPYHMSYPFPVDDGAGGMLLTAETWAAGNAQLWRAEARAQSAGTIMAGRPIVDPTLWQDGGRWWLFCTFQDRDPNGALFLHHAPTLRGPWTEHPCNPVQTGRGRSRPAGPLFRMGDALVRPAQDCSATYGGAIQLQLVTRLDVAGYQERPLRRIGPVPGPYGAGLHTICAAGQRTLIDGKRWRNSSAGLPAKLLRGVSKRLGQAESRLQARSPGHSC